MTGYDATIISNPEVYGNREIFEFIVGSNITLTCMINRTPPIDSKFRWCNVNDCSINLEQSIKLTDLKLSDGGKLNCSLIVDDVKYASKVIELRVIGKLYVFAYEWLKVFCIIFMRMKTKIINGEHTTYIKM